MNERDYWLCWSYWSGRAEGLGWSPTADLIPDHLRYLYVFREAYDRGVEDYMKFDERSV